MRFNIVYQMFTDYYDFETIVELFLENDTDDLCDLMKDIDNEK